MCGAGSPAAPQRLSGMRIHALFRTKSQSFLASSQYFPRSSVKSRVATAGKYADASHQRINGYWLTLNRREDEAALRDAIALAKPGQELGPAGRVYSAFRTLVGPGDPLRPGRLAAVAADLQSPFDPGNAAEVAAALRETGGRGRPAPIAAAAAAEAVIALKRDAEPLALLCTDAALAKTLGWPTPLPLLASELFARRATGEGRRPRPGEAGWGILVALAYARAALAALDLALDLSRPAARLAEAVPKLRAKGKGRALDALLGDDAVSAAAPLPGLSDRARRRLFERLVALGAARELTGRPTFRLYGL